MEPEKSAAKSLKGESSAENMIQLVPRAIPRGLASANALPPTSPQHGQGSSDDRGASPLHCYDRAEPEEPYTISLKGDSCEDNMIQLVPPGIPEGLESAKDLPPASPRHGQSSSDDRGAHQVSAESSAAGGSNLLKSTVDHEEAYDSSTFPISCTLKKHAQGFYILSGACCLCGQTFRATGGVRKSNGRMERWRDHNSCHDRMIQHAR